MFSICSNLLGNVRIVDINDTKLDTLSGISRYIFHYEILKKVTTLLLEY